MGSDFKAIPLIDIGPLVEKIDDPSMANDADLMEVVRMLDDACKEAGFFYVKGHGITESLMKEVRDVTRKFFQLPYEEKLKIKMTPQSRYRGYQMIGENITKGKPDMHEAIDCYTPIRPGRYGDLVKPMEGSNLWPENPSNCEALLENYINLSRDLSRKIMRGIALALGGAIDAFEGETAGDPFWVLRLIGYPVDIPEDQCTDTVCRAHTDYDLVKKRRRGERGQDVDVMWSGGGEGRKGRHGGGARGPSSSPARRRSSRPPSRLHPPCRAPDSLASKGKGLDLCRRAPCFSVPLRACSACAGRTPSAATEESRGRGRRSRIHALRRWHN